MGKDRLAQAAEGLDNRLAGHMERHTARAVLEAACGCPEVQAGTLCRHTLALHKVQEDTLVCPLDLLARLVVETKAAARRKDACLLPHGEEAAPATQPC